MRDIVSKTPVKKLNNRLELHVITKIQAGINGRKEPPFEPILK